MSSSVVTIRARSALSRSSHHLGVLVPEGRAVTFDTVRNGGRPRQEELIDSIVPRFGQPRSLVD